MDALPIHETNSNLPYRSIYDGVGHKCGHDGHMTILTGLAGIYAKERPSAGRVVLLYQPDEETGTGAYECCNHPNFQKIKPDYAFALHNFPNFLTHEIICRVGTFTSSVRLVAIKLTGKAAHSAMPETGISPALAIAEMTQASQEIQKKYDKDEEFALVVPIHFNMGVSSSGVAPSYGEAHFTMRSGRDETVDAIWQDFLDKIKEISVRHKLQMEYEVLENYAANINDEEAVSMIKKASENNELNYSYIEKPFRGGEDFGEITKRYKGAMFGLGAGLNKPELHNSNYDFPDEIIPSGILMFKDLIDQVLSSLIEIESIKGA